jgi:AcrR family transcriptional regulator
MDSRDKALQSARELMLSKGKDGVRMQEIADHAGINKGLLHYYFKSKEKLFHEIFVVEFAKVYGDLNRILESDNTMDAKLSGIIDRYYDLLWENPNLPTFVMFEVNKNPKLVHELSEEIALQTTIILLDQEFKRNGIFSSPTFAFQVILNIISMCIFPFMMKPMVEEMSIKSGKNWESIMLERKDFLKKVVISSFK